MAGLICTLRETAVEGDAVSRVIDQCQNVSSPEAARLSVEWGERKEAGEGGRRVFTLDEWVLLLKGRSPALSRLPVAQLRETVISEVARKLGMKSDALPNDFRFVLVRPGEEISADVIREAGGNVRLNLVPQEKPAEGKKRTDKPLLRDGVSPEFKKIEDEYIDGSGGCFSGCTFLKLEGGDIITFEGLAGYDALAKLPKVACWDTDSRKVIYQQPLAVLEHHYEEPQVLIEFHVGRDETAPLKVTDNHPILSSDGRDIPAGKLLGQAAANPFGEGKTGHVLKQKALTFTRDVYNLSLTKKREETKLSPYYLVSANGDDWLVAHNFKFCV